MVPTVGESTLTVRRFAFAMLVSVLVLGGCLPPAGPTVTQAPRGSEPSMAAPTTKPSSTPATASAKTGASPATIDACALLPLPVLSKIVGSTVDRGRAMPSGGWISGQCAWSTSTASFELSVATNASIEAFGDPGITDAGMKLASYRAQASGANAKPKDVDGIGDGAVLTSNGIAAVKNDKYLELRNLGLTSDQIVQIMTLATEAL